MAARIKNTAITAGFIALLIILLFQKCRYAKLEKEFLEFVPKTDTVFVKKPYEVIKTETRYIEKPVYVKVFQKDTTLRKEAEKSDIITAVEIQPKEIRIDRITPQGIVFSNQYDMPAYREIKIDNLGNLQVKKKRRIFSKLLCIAGAVAAGYLIIHNIHH